MRGMRGSKRARGCGGSPHRRLVSFAYWLSRNLSPYTSVYAVRAEAEKRLDPGLAELAEALYAALSELAESFPGKPSSWYARAALRALVGVRRVSDRHWVVRGLPELGDRYPLYNVVLTRDGRYVCDCFSHMYGHIRKARICTHIAAVIVARRVSRRLL